MEEDVVKPTERPSISQSLFSTLRKRTRKTLSEANFFGEHPVWTPILTSNEQKLATRIFVVLLFLSMSVILFYTCLAVRTREVTRKNFSLEQFNSLATRYSTTIHAPCSQPSIPINALMSFNPRFHQICSSPFVGSRWIASLFSTNATSHNILDFRTFGFAQFRALALLCRAARQAIHDAQRSLEIDHFTTSDLLTRSQFDEITSVMMNNLRLNILAEKRQIVSLISFFIAQNRLISALRTNYYIQSVGFKGYITYNGVYEDTNQTVCDCQIQLNQCVSPAGLFYNWTLPEPGEPAKTTPLPHFNIPGWMAGCTPLDSTRQSTLECFYNQTCIDTLRLVSQGKTNRMKSLNFSHTNFALNTTIGQMFDQHLFIESWNHSWNYETYFASCRAPSLSYSYQRPFHLSWIFATCLSAYGGLVLIWQLIIPLLIKLRNKIRSKVQENTTKDIHRAMRKSIFQFNLFRSDDANDPEEERVGIIATRLYIVLLFIGLLSLGVFIVVTDRPQTKTVRFPSLSQFDDLSQNHSSTLTCSCSRQSMSYRRIMSITPNYHQICTSAFLDDIWLSYFGRVEKDLDTVTFSSLDFRVVGEAFFALTRTLCRSSNETINNAHRVFHSTRLFTVNVLSRSQFHIETQTRLKLFKQQTIDSYLNLVDFIRGSIQNNHFSNQLWTSIRPCSTTNNQTLKRTLALCPRNYYTNSCSCASSSQCTRSVGFYPLRASIYTQPNVTVRGLVIGCYPMNSYLSSTFECLFDQNCLQLIIDHYDFGAIDLVRPLDERAKAIRALKLNKTRFPPNTTLKTIVSELYVEDWETNADFSAYFHRCEPKKCTYTVRQRFDKTYMLTMMLGFYGGLASILEIILPVLVKYLRSCWRKRRHQPTITTTATHVEHHPSPASEENLFTRLHKLNLFPTPNPSHDELIATRIYLILFTMCLIAATLYAGPFNTETKTTIIKSPTSTIVNHLHQKNMSTLSCPCTTAAINYSTFLSITPRFHPICSREWMYTYNDNDSISSVLSSHYRLLTSFCQRSKRFVENAQISFYSRELISKETITEPSFFNQTESFLTSFIDHTPAHFRRILSLTIGSFQVNQLLNLFLNNWQVSFTDEHEKFLIATSPRVYPSSNCSCAVSSRCVEALTPNISVGCLPFDGFRQSKLEDLVMENLTNDLFIVQWENETNYTAYFETCNPSECQYTLPDRNNPVFVLTFLLGLYGGLMYILRMIIDGGLHSYRWWQRHRH